MVVPCHLLKQSLGVKKKQIWEAHNPRQNVNPPPPKGREKPPAKNEMQYANKLSLESILHNAIIAEINNEGDHSHKYAISRSIGFQGQTTEE